MIVFEHSVSFLVLALGIGLAACVGYASVRRYVYDRAGMQRLLFLYGAFLIALGWCLLQPGCRTYRTHERRPRFAVLLDTSKSMQQSPTEETDTRWMRAQQALDMDWLDQISREVDVALYGFDYSLSPSMDIAMADTLSPTGTTTRIRENLERFAGRTVGQDVAGVLLLTDGHDTRETSERWASDGYPYPLYTVRLEDDIDIPLEPDLAIDSVETPRRVLRGRSTEVRVVVSGHETGGVPVSVQLYREDTLLDEQPTQIPVGGGERELTFRLQHDAIGVFAYRLHVPPLPAEENLANNDYRFTVTVQDEQNRVVYLEGVPRFAYRFLRRVLLADQQMMPAIFYSLADGTMRAGSEVDQVTPDLSDAALLEIKAVILGNLTATEITEGRAQRLVDFVEDGGSLVLLGGGRAWTENGFMMPPLRQVVPFSVVNDASMHDVSEPLPTRLTTAGRMHPVFADDPGYWDVMPPVLNVYSVDGLRAGAEVLVAANTPEGEKPLIVVQRYGQGRVVAILTDSLWRWQLDPEAEHAPYARFWSQLLSWLLPDDEELDEESITLFAGQEEVYPGEPITLSVRVPSALQQEGETPTVTIADPDERQTPFSLQAAEVRMPDGRGLPGYALDYRPTVPGRYRAKATYAADAMLHESDPIYFYLLDTSPERVRAPVNTDVLQALARASGGRYYEDLESLNRGLRNFTADHRRERLSDYFSLWQHWAVVLFCMALLSSIWILRKRMHMP